MMTDLRKQALEKYAFPALLLAVGIISYGLLINRLGFYWDDWPMNWIGTVLGPDALTRYFSTNRPYLGVIINFLLMLLGPTPLPWHICALICHWFAALMLWLLLRQVLPHSGAADWTALLFMVYPGPVQHFIALVFSPFYLIFGILILSLACSVYAEKYPAWHRWITAAGLLLSFLNLLTLDYFFMLELLRPLVIWAAISGSTGTAEKLKETLKKWLPYLALFVAMVIWRFFIFDYQTQNYDLQLLDGLKTNPLQSVGGLLTVVITDLYTASIGAWVEVFRLGVPAVVGKKLFLTTTLVILAVIIIWVFYYLFVRRPDVVKYQTSGNKFHRKYLLWAAVGLIGMLLAGLPFWATGLPINLGFPNSRTLLPFTLGGSLLLGSLLAALPIPWRYKFIFPAIFLGFAAGWQFRTADSFRRDWNLQASFFWQLSWRVPALEPKTALLSNEMPFKYPTDNSLSAPLNWLYTNADSSEGMPYILYYPTLRLGSGLPALEEGLPISQDYLATRFTGSTSQMVSLFFSPPGCLHVLDPELSQENIMVPELLRSAAKVTSLDVVLLERNGSTVDPSKLFGVEPQHGWCYYYQKAELARQFGDWEQVVMLAETAFSLDDHPNDPSERLPFIEGYAHTARWEDAVTQTQETLAITPVMQPVLCKLWQKIAAEIETSPEQQQALDEIDQTLQCQF